MITGLQAQEMLTRCERNKRRSVLPPCDHDECPKTHCLHPASAVPEQREIGHGGIHSEIEQWLKSLGNRCFYIHSRSDRKTTYEVGNADFIGWILHPGKGFGWPFAIECKSKANKPTIQQLARLKQAESAGAIVGIARSLEEFKSILGMP